MREQRLEKGTRGEVAYLPVACERGVNMGHGLEGVILRMDSAMCNRMNFLYDPKSGFLVVI